MGSLIETEIDLLYQQAFKGERRGKRVGRVRRILAYVFKFIAAGGSLVVATGYFPNYNQPIGVAILIAVLLDSVSFKSQTTTVGSAGWVCICVPARKSK